MKPLHLLIPLGLLLINALESNAQILDRIERKVKNRVDRKVDKTIDKGLDKAEKGIDDATAPKKDKPLKSNGGVQTASPVTTIDSRYDFIAGEKVLFSDDLTADKIGDFPSRWNTNGSGEVVTLNGQPEKWLKIPHNTITYPEINKVLPENFTIEFDLFYPEGNTRPPITFGFSENANPVKNKLAYKKLFYFRIDHVKNLVGSSTSIYSGREDNKSYPVNSMANKPVRVSISVNKTRIRLYLEQEKVFDLPRGFEPTILRSNFHFRAAEILPAAKESFFIGNLRVAEGSVDFRSRLLAGEKVSTTAILFDVNAASIKPQSYGIIREIGMILQENKEMHLNITGHTDSDGPDNANLELSRRRADAIKTALKKQYGIDLSRLQTEGKGESAPVADNNTTSGKAENRRVEFIATPAAGL
ncbi:OmpA family protein [Chitinophaga barathri]|uniref:OmpA family protein n=1 Tax=Chitinophaga barathri TaxID=1647451 RepID=A0A3N4M637_9BACT|nr:OmpA family protein [Chitinophaga barathri]RPD38691.1 OmpA family protein [Chitinophaga barathri]